LSQQRQASAAFAAARGVVLGRRINGLSDAGQILISHFLESGIGVAAAGAILFYLSRPTVRRVFT